VAVKKNLRAYQRKRDFAVTPEPPPGPAPRRGGRLRFMVHKHHARRLHYDLRLEMDGALASWAVPKGPSYDPAEKRLAVQTEDHPLEYGEFEGRIPEGEYGGGDSIIWDRGSYDTEPPGQASAQRQEGHLRLELDGEKLKGRWHLVRTRPTKSGKAQWLLFKAKDGAADPRYDVVAERPESVASGRRVTRGPEPAEVLARPRATPEALLERLSPPMLATLVDAAPPDPASWRLEVKYDGFRALAGLAGGRVALWSRNGLDLATRFPQVARALAEVVVGEAVVDGEICALDARGRPRFELLQRGAGTGVVYYAFDLLWLDGEDLRPRPLEARRDLLVSLLGNAPEGVALSEELEGPAARALAEAARRGQEGVILKLKGSPYEARRTKTWLKLKAVLGQEVAIVGYEPLTGAPRQVGALIVAIADGGKLRHAGKVGTGFTAAVRRDLLRLLEPDRVEKPALEGAPRLRDAVWVEPRRVAQVQFTEWTADGKLRHPSFQGLRPDKTPLECVRERPEAPAPLVTLSTPDRLLYPADGITKRRVADYYAAVAAPLLRALADRPLALEHWPKGIDEPSWFQQNLGAEAEPWMDLVETPTRTGRRVRHLIASRPETLTWLAQMSALTIHMWSSRRGSLDSPDWIVFDLDPAEGRGVDQAIEPARALHRLLDELKLPSVVKTSGKRGLHILVPVAPGTTHKEAADWGCRVADALAGELPEVTTRRAKSGRHGRLYLDCLQNGYGKTLVAPYSLRGVPGAPVSTPLAWDEVTPRLDPSRFRLETLPARLARVGDLFAPALERGARLPRIA
jgi:bifunctional non-homologous end joining protein LigD